MGAWGPKGDGSVRFLAGWSPPAAQGEGSLLFRPLPWAGLFPPLCRVDVADVKTLQEKAVCPLETSSYSTYVCGAQRY